MTIFQQIQELWNIYAQGEKRAQTALQQIREFERQAALHVEPADGLPGRYFQVTRNKVAICPGEPGIGPVFLAQPQVEFLRDWLNMILPGPAIVQLEEINKALRELVEGLKLQHQQAVESVAAQEAEITTLRTRLEALPGKGAQ